MEFKESVFYPVGGGQPSDTGVVRGTKDGAQAPLPPREVLTRVLFLWGCRR